MLLASGYLLLVTYTTYWGLLFGFVFAMSVVLIMIDIFTIPVFKEKFFSGIIRRKNKESMSEDISSLVLKRANYKCQSCGKVGKKIYHMDKEKSHNDPNNLLCLCDACLAKVQAGTISGEKLYFMRLGEENAKQK